MRPCRVQIDDQAAAAVRRGRPWVYREAVSRAADEAAGAVVDLVDRKGDLVGRGLWDPGAAVAVKVLSRGREEPSIPAVLRARLAGALALRRRLLPMGELEAWRLVNGEGDRLPSLAADVLGPFVVVELTAEAWAPHRGALCDALRTVMAPRGIVEKSRLRPGPGGEVVQHLWGEEPPDEMLVREGPARFYVELRGTRKTGLFLDQRETRAALRGVARGEALNAFAYTGSLSVAAAQGGARVTTLDLARPALERARHNFGANSLSPDAHEWIQGDAFEELPALVRAGRKFDLVVLDPPAFATTKKRVFQAERHWKDLATHGARLLRPGGVLVASSPMAAFPAAALERALADGAARAGIPLAVFDVRSQPADHPVDPACPERRYLKVLFAARVEEEQAQITTSARAGGRSPAPARAPR